MRWFILVLIVVGIGLTALPGPAAPHQVISLKSFIEWDEWRLDITWSAKDAFEDKDHIGQMEATGTARYVLKRLDRQDAWGHWQTTAVDSQNLTYRAFWQSKHDAGRLDYRAKAGAMVAPLADLQIGGVTPGYMLICQGGFPAEVIDRGSPMDCPLVLATTEKDVPGLTGVAAGPLPESGMTIHGSRVIMADIPPFLTGMAGRTRLGITFVLKPVALAPLVPPKKR